MENNENRIIFLKGQKTILRPLENKDVAKLQKWINDEETRIYLSTYLPISEIQEEKWLENLVERKNDIILGIEVDNKLIGNIGIHSINWKDRTAVTGTVIGDKDYLSKGYGTDAKMTLLNYAFNTLNLRKIDSAVIEYNERSLKYSLKCGYQIEGRKRKNIFKNGKYHDEILLGVFKEEWLPEWEKYNK
jgi:RimJ/RimL family protein N-acetyltransferase